MPDRPARRRPPGAVEKHRTEGANSASKSTPDVVVISVAFYVPDAESIFDAERRLGKVWVACRSSCCLWDGGNGMVGACLSACPSLSFSWLMRLLAHLLGCALLLAELFYFASTLLLTGLCRDAVSCTRRLPLTIWMHCLASRIEKATHDPRWPGCDDNAPLVSRHLRAYLLRGLSSGGSVGC